MDFQEFWTSTNFLIHQARISNRQILVKCTLFLTDRLFFWVEVSQKVAFATCDVTYDTCIEWTCFGSVDSILITVSKITVHATSTPTFKDAIRIETFAQIHHIVSPPTGKHSSTPHERFQPVSWWHDWDNSKVGSQRAAVTATKVLPTSTGTFLHRREHTFRQPCRP